MASIRIPFPENDQPSLVKLQGSRITIGRLPFNTVQIIDRTISGFHAELILDGGHYRLHDRGSTNGTFVNGELTTDFHLREACKIAFGTVECDFDPATDEAGSGEDAVPTRGEINSVRQENAELRSMLAALREQVAALLNPTPGDQSEQTVSRDEFTKIVGEREALKEAQLRLEKEIARMKEEYAVVRRDRDNLQKAWDSAKGQLAKAQPKVEAVAFVEVPGVQKASAAKAPVPAAPSAPAAPMKPVPAPASPQAPSSLPNRPTVPLMKPAPPLPAPTGATFPAPKPVAPPSRLVSAPTVVAKAPAANSSGVRPFPKAPTVAPGSPSVPKAPQPSGTAQKPAPGVMQPRPSVMPVHAPGAGPKGTQKLA